MLRECLESKNFIMIVVKFSTIWHEIRPNNQYNQKTTTVK